MFVIRSSSAWSLNQIEDFFNDCVIPVRLACLTRSGAPIVCSLWYVYEDGIIWCATQKTAKVVSYLEDQPGVGFEIAPDAPPYRGVRGQGQVTLSEGRGVDVLTRLIDRYLGDRDSDFARWLIERGRNEVAIGIVPEWVTSWDFESRMSSIQDN